MKKILFCLVILVTTISMFGQTTLRKNTLYGQFGGNGLFLSLNYERQLTKTQPLGVRAGVGHSSSDEKFRITIPASIYYLLQVGNTKSYIDFSLGATWSEAKLVDKELVSDARGHIVSFVPGISYRYQAQRGFMLRAGFTPFINKYAFILVPEISMGISF